MKTQLVKREYELKTTDKSISSEQLTMRALREGDWYPDITTRSLGPRRRKDLFNVFDGIAVHPSEGVLFWQATKRKCNELPRVNKVRHADVLPIILGLGHGVEVWTWRRLKRKGNRWCATVTRIVESETRPAGLYWEG